MWKPGGGGGEKKQSLLLGFGQRPRDPRPVKGDTFNCSSEEGSCGGGGEGRKRGGALLSSIWPERSLFSGVRLRAVKAENKKKMRGMETEERSKGGGTEAQVHTVRGGTYEPDRHCNRKRAPFFESRGGIGKKIQEKRENNNGGREVLFPHRGSKGAKVSH